MGVTPDEGANAISVRHLVSFLEGTPSDLGRTLAPTLTNLPVVLLAVSSEALSPVLWHQPDAPPLSRRQFLLASLTPTGRLTAGAPR